MKKVILSIIIIICGAFSFSYSADDSFSSSCNKIKLTNLPEEIIHQIISSVSEEKSLEEAVEKIYNSKLVDNRFYNAINNQFTLSLFIKNCKKRFGDDAFQKLCQAYLTNRVKNVDKINFLLSLNRLVKNKFIDINLLEIRLNSKESILQEVENFKQIAKKNGYLSLIFAPDNVLEAWLGSLGNMRLIDLSVIFFDLDLIKILIKNGADINAKNGNGCTALFELMSLEVERLVNRLVGVNFKSFGKLYTEFKLKYNEMLNFLLKNGADIHIKNNNGMTILMAAISAGNIKMSKLLLKKGVDVHARSNNGITALMIAVMVRNISLIRLLCEKGVDVNARDNNGTTACAIAISNFDEKIQDLLIFEYGAQ